MMEYLKMSHSNIDSGCSHTLPGPVLPPHLPPSSKRTNWICQHWRESHYTRPCRHWKLDPLMQNVEMENGTPLESRVHAASCATYICTHTYIYRHFRVLTNFSHGTEMRSSCPAREDDENTWPELASCWQWQLPGLSCPEEQSAHDSLLQSINDPH